MTRFTRPTRTRLATTLTATAAALTLAACGSSWPHPKPAADSVHCDHLASESAERLRAIPGVADARASVSGHGCIDYDGESRDAFALLTVELATTETTETTTPTPEHLIQTQDQIHTIYLEEIAPNIPARASSVIEFGEHATLQFGGGHLPLTEEEARAILEYTDQFPQTAIVAAVRNSGPSVTPATSASYITLDTTLDARTITDPAEMRELLEPAWTGLTALGDALESRTTNTDGILPTIVLSDSARPSRSGPFIIGFEHGSDFDPLWAEPASAAIELTEQPEIRRVWLNIDYRERYNNAEITLAEPGTELSARSLELLDVIYAHLAALGMPAVEPTLKA